MLQIALISEGPSDNIVLKHIIERYLGSDNCYVHGIFPEEEIRNGLSRQKGAGGWHEVLKHCDTEFIGNALSTNDYVVIEIDTDSCEQVGFDISRHHQGREKTHQQLHADVCHRLLRDIDKKHHDNILCAVCVNQMECWILPLVHTDNANSCAVTGCVDRLNRGLQKKNMLCVEVADKNSRPSQEAYRQLMRKAKKATDIRQCSLHSHGFRSLLAGLDKIMTECQTPEE